MLLKTPGSTGEFGEVIVTEGLHEGGTFIPGVHSYPAYTCGHCTCIVVMRPDRTRPRLTCHSCGRMVCDKEICHPDVAGCTPMYALAAGHFEGTGPLALRARAIMQGATTLAEASKIILGG